MLLIRQVCLAQEIAGSPYLCGPNPLSLLKLSMMIQIVERTCKGRVGFEPP